MQESVGSEEGGGRPVGNGIWFVEGWWQEEFFILESEMPEVDGAVRSRRASMKNVDGGVEGRAG